MPYTLENAEDLAAQAPRSSFIPPPEIRRNLGPGDVVKLSVERMWVLVSPGREGREMRDAWWRRDGARYVRWRA